MDSVIVDLHPQAHLRANPVLEYLRQCRDLFIEPTKFFRQRFAQMTLTEALAFGVVSIWLSSLIVFIWGSLTEILLLKMLEPWTNELEISIEDLNFVGESMRAFLTSAAFVVIKPFLAVMGIGLYGLVLWISAQFLLRRRADDSDPDQDGGRAPKVEYLTMVKVLAVASAGNWLAVVPLFGGILAYVTVIAFTIFGLKEHFRVPTSRAAAVVLLPQLVCLMLFAFLFAFGLLLLLGLAASFAV